MQLFRVRKPKWLKITLLLIGLGISSWQLWSSMQASQVLPATTDIPSSPTPVTQEATASGFLVTQVVDGDTFKVQADGQVMTVRLIGVDTPETVDPRKPVQCFGKEASEYAKSLLLNKVVVLEKDVSETDRYGRWLRYVYLDGEMINEKMVKDGMAAAKTYPPDVKYQQLLTAAQATAQAQQLGLWNPQTCPSPVP